jgi:hypothetical protein
MARTIARFSDTHLRAVVDAGRLPNRFLRDELVRLLGGRRDIILRRYFSKLSPLGNARVQGAELCADDYAVSAGLVPRHSFFARAWATPKHVPLAAPSVRTEGDRVCVRLPGVAGQPAGKPEYLIVDIGINGDTPPGPARFHLYQVGQIDYRLVGLERPVNGSAPD